MRTKTRTRPLNKRQGRGTPNTVMVTLRGRVLPHVIRWWHVITREQKAGPLVQCQTGDGRRERHARLVAEILF